MRLRNHALRWGVVACLVITSPAVASAARVGVYMAFGARSPSSLVLDEMKKEASAILLPLGVNFDWRLASENQGKELFSRVVFVKFEGHCSPESNAGGVVGDEFPLAATKVTEVGVIPYSTVDCHAVRTLLFSGGDIPIRREHFMGRALGRVLAHELLHVLLRATGHTRHGPGRESLSSHDLKGSGEDFDRNEKELLRMCLEKAGGDPKASPWCDSLEQGSESKLNCARSQAGLAEQGACALAEEGGVNVRDGQ
jgi:hypothetical protein